MSKLLRKVCGLTRAEDVALCAGLGFDFTGFIFVPESPRAVTPEQVAGMDSGNARRVGVFAKMDAETVLEYAHAARLDYLQLHGGESPEYCAAVGPQRVIKVLWPEKCSPGELRADMERFAPVCAFFLLDAGSGGGGSGKSLPFERLSGLDSPRPWLLAGGLGPDNLPEALRACSPDGIDLNSALETAPGIKDAARLRAAAILTHSSY